MNVELLYAVLTEVDAFERSQQPESDLSLKAFTNWLVNRVGQSPNQSNLVRGGEPPHFMISRLVYFMQRYAGMYVKRVLGDTHLTTFDDFTYLATLARKPGLTKVELIEINIHGKTTGMEIIRRLISTGLIEQADHATDKRSKALTITANGLNELEKIRGPLSLVSTLIVGDLGEEEQLHLLSLLSRLHAFHYPVYLKGTEGVDRILHASGADKAQPNATNPE